MTIEYEFSTRIAASPQEVFDALSDLDALPDYIPAEVRIETLTEGEFGEGTQWREYRKMMGREATEVFEVTECEPPHRLVLFVDGTKGTTGSGEFTYLYQLEADNGATRLDLEARIDDIGCIAEQLSKLFAGSFKDAVEKDLDGLKHFAESKSET